MAKTTRPFEPLMIAIQQVLEELGSSRELHQPLDAYVQSLQELYDDYSKCCCMLAEVVKVDDSETNKTQAR
jgi:hypothetical protein